MNKTLRDRFYYGNSEWPSFFSPEAELVYKSPRRQEQLITLAQVQIQVQKDTAKKIRQSSLEAADIVAAEIESQTSEFTNSLEDLRGSVEGLGDTIAWAFGEAAERLASEIDRAANRICADLTEIRWQLAQQQETLTGILRVLSESRNNEARQLVKQGIRYYINSQIPTAKKLFKDALEKDATDYQVLMNLGFIALEENEFKEAQFYFKNALNLPEKPDLDMRVNALNALARLYFANNDFNSALACAEESIRQNQRKDPNDIYTAAIYAFHANKREKTLDYIERAIRMDPIYFSKVTVEPDLAPFREEILGLLSRMSMEAKRIVMDILRKTRAFFEQCDLGAYPETAGFSEQVGAQIGLFESSVQLASYRLFLALPKKIQKAKETTAGIYSLKRLLKERNPKLEECEKKQIASADKLKIRDEKRAIYNRMRSRHDNEQAILMTYSRSATDIKHERITWYIFIFAFALLLIMMAILAIFSPGGNRGILLGSFIGLAFFAAWDIFRRRVESRQRLLYNYLFEIKNLNQEILAVGKEVTSLENDIKMLDTKIETQKGLISNLIGELHIA